VGVECGLLQTGGYGRRRRGAVHSTRRWPGRGRASSRTSGVRLAAGAGQRTGRVGSAAAGGSELRPVRGTPLGRNRGRQRGNYWPPTRRSDWPLTVAGVDHACSPEVGEAGGHGRPYGQGVTPDPGVVICGCTIRGVEVTLQIHILPTAAHVAAVLAVWIRRIGSRCPTYHHREG
jgi:hypothetical protein